MISENDNCERILVSPQQYPLQTEKKNIVLL